MKSILILILIIGSFTCAAQRATLDTTLTGRIFLKDTKTNEVFEVLNDGGKSYILKSGKKLFIYRRETPRMPTAREFSTTKN